MLPAATALNASDDATNYSLTLREIAFRRSGQYAKRKLVLSQIRPIQYYDEKRLAVAAVNNLAASWVGRSCLLSMIE